MGTNPGRTGSPKKSFGAELEERARQILERRSHTAGRPWAPTSALEDAIALSLDQVRDARARERVVLESLLKEECDVGTELLQMEDRTPRYSPYRFPERAKLRARLARLAEERRRLVIAQADRVNTFHDRLLSLLGKHAQLTPSL